jgi:hypothetical protein
MKLSVMCKPKERGDRSGFGMDGTSENLSIPDIFDILLQEGNP